MKNILIFCFSFFCYHNLIGSVQADTTNNFISASINSDSTELKILFNDSIAILTQVTKKDERPYLHPILTFDKKEILTEYRPKHHLHQTGIYWGLKEVNGIDYFMNWDGRFWQFKSLNILVIDDKHCNWEIVYNVYNNGSKIMEEKYNWIFTLEDEKYILDLTWNGTAFTDIEIEQFYVGGLFMRTHWNENVPAKLTCSNGLIDLDIDSTRGIWCDLGVKLRSKADKADRICVFDHPSNFRFPTGWRTDSQYGFGPSAQILGNWGIPEGTTSAFRYRILIYDGSYDEDFLRKEWLDYIN